MKLNTITNADCVKGMASLPDACADLIIIDGPYYKTKGDFDFTLGDKEWLKLYDDVAKQCKRVLKPHGTLFVWGHALKIAYQQIIFDKYFCILNNLIWHKKDGQANRNSPDQMRTFAPVTERCLMYAHTHHSDNNAYNYNEGFEPIRLYFRREIEKVGTAAVANYCGISTRAVGHWITKSQWTFPSEIRYKQMQKLGICKKPYATIRKEYENVQRKHGRYFNNNGKLQTDILCYTQDTNITKLYDHETQKGTQVTKALIETCSQKGDLVVVPFVGSGTECEVAQSLSRNFIGWEIDKKYCEVARKRLKIR